MKRTTESSFFSKKLLLHIGLTVGTLGTIHSLILFTTIITRQSLHAFNITRLLDLDTAFSYSLPDAIGVPLLAIVCLLIFLLIRHFAASIDALMNHKS